VGFLKLLLKKGFDEGKIDPKKIAGICFGGWTVMSFLVDENGVHSPMLSIITI